MVLKLFRAAWFLSMAAALASLLFTYAGLPENVVIQDDANGQVAPNRELLFYLMMLGLAVTNVLVYVIGKMYKKEEDFRSWFHGLVVTINIFFIVAMNLVQTYNSGERFNFTSIQNIIYGSIALVVLWAVSWPLYSIYKRIFAKPVVL
jgi:hypothetical protein